MKSCLVLSDLPVAYKVQNFNNANLTLIQSKWEKIKSAVERTINLTNKFGIDRDTLTSANALIPIAYYLIQHPHLTLMGESEFDIENTALIRRWFTASLLNNVFGGSSDSILTNIRNVLQKNASSEDFVLSEINKEIAKSGRQSYFDDDALDSYLSIMYSQRLSFLALSILYDDNNWGVIPYHKDHIFPQSLFNLRAMREAGFDDTKWYRFNQLKDRVGNLELLLAHENEEKSNTTFEKWIETRNSRFLKRHLIPDSPELWKFENFEQFIEEREFLIVKRLGESIGHAETEK